MPARTPNTLAALASYIMVSLCCSSVQLIQADSPPSVGDIFVNTDYHSAVVSWRYPDTHLVHAFLLSYCELDAWNTRRCTKQFVPSTGKDRSATSIAHSTNNNRRRTTPTGSIAGEPVQYSVHAAPLKMDTEYRFQVAPLLSDRMSASTGNNTAASILAKTKEFSAVTRCMAGRMEVQVRTGRHFSGRLAVEDDSQCQLRGQPHSEKQLYTLVVDQHRCRTQRLGNQVRAFVIVQEQDQLQTHSTRRFLVVCDYTSHTITVGAGVKLPFGRRVRGSSSSIQPVDFHTNIFQQTPVDDKVDSQGISMAREDTDHSNNNSISSFNSPNSNPEKISDEENHIRNATYQQLKGVRNNDEVEIREEREHGNRYHGNKSVVESRLLNKSLLNQGKSDNYDSGIAKVTLDSNTSSVEDTRVTNKSVGNTASDKPSSHNSGGLLEKGTAELENISEASRKGRAMVFQPEAQVDLKTNSSQLSIAAHRSRYPTSKDLQDQQHSAKAEKLISPISNLEHQDESKNILKRSPNGRWNIALILSSLAGLLITAAVAAVVVIKNRMEAGAATYNVTNNQPVNHIIVRGEYPGVSC